MSKEFYKLNDFLKPDVVDFCKLVVKELNKVSSIKKLDAIFMDLFISESVRFAFKDFQISVPRRSHKDSILLSIFSYVNLLDYGDFENIFKKHALVITDNIKNIAVLPPNSKQFKEIKKFFGAVFSRYEIKKQSDFKIEIESVGISMDQVDFNIKAYV